MTKIARTMTTAAAILTGALVAGVGCDNARYSEAFQPEGDITHVVIRSDAGTVDLMAAQAEAGVRVERTIRAPEGALHLAHRVELNADGGETLVLEAGCVKLLPCAVDIRLDVPEGVTVDVVLGEGDVYAEGIGTLTAEINRGSLHADIGGPLSAQVGSGSVSATLPLDADATVAVGHGDIELRIPAGPWQLSSQAARLYVSEDIQGESAEGGRLQLTAPAGGCHGAGRGGAGRAAGLTSRVLSSPPPCTPTPQGRGGRC